jgi:hypothetical protein
MMMRDQRDVVAGASGGEFTCDQEIAAEAGIVKPDNGVLRRSVGKEAGNDVMGTAGDEPGTTVLLSQVAERAVGLAGHINASHLATEVCEPAVVRRLAAGQHNLRDGRTQGANEMRCGQFNDAAHTAGAKMAVDDDQFHARTIFHDAARPAIVFSELFVSRLDGGRAAEGSCGRTMRRVFVAMFTQGFRVVRSWRPLGWSGRHPVN